MAKHIFVEVKNIEDQNNNLIKETTAYDKRVKSIIRKGHLQIKMNNPM